MSDYKEAYSIASRMYINVVVPSSSIDQARYNRSKGREAKYNGDWCKTKVNINEIVDKFIPENETHSVRSESGYKFVFEGEHYLVKCDKVGGYLRIFNKDEDSYCLVDGTPSDNNSLTHFKIKKREEM